jgi:hypothetical protein
MDRRAADPHHQGRTTLHGPIFRPSAGKGDGAAVTMLAEAGCSVAQIVAITQHSLATDSNFGSLSLANQAIAQFENAKETEFANRLQTSAKAPLSNTNRKD